MNCDEIKDIMQLSPHLTLEEFTRSVTAERLKISNIPNAQQIENMRNLCVQVLEPLRAHIRAPVVISSGFRCPRLNRAVGGVANSQHMQGEAADIVLYAHDAEGNKLSLSSSLSLAMSWINDNCPFDQLIFEKAGTSIWLHVSCKKDISKNRREVMRIVKD